MSEIRFDEVDPEVIVSEILMLRTDPEKAMFIVEGGSDEKLLWNFIDHEACEIIIAEGKENALAAMGIVKKECTAGVICLVDRDYDDFLEVDVATDSVIVTEYHDIEQIILRSNALSRILLEMGSQQKIAKLTNGGKSVFEVLVDSAHPLGALRYVALRDKIPLKFKLMSYQSFDRKTIAPDKAKMCRDVINNSRSDVKAADLLTLIQEVTSQNHDRYMMCNGHDLTELLGKSLQSLIGSVKAIFVTKDEIESKLRLAFGISDFKQTKIYLDIVAWQQRNVDFQVLA
ncbi:MAG: DUF4435 domain-containing protein [Sphingobium sp.]